MTKVFIFLFAVTIASIGAMWFIENDGSIAIEWLGYHIQTSVAFMVLASLVLFIVTTVIIQGFLYLKSAPKRYRRAVRERKRENGLEALTKGFAAIASGDMREAKKHTKHATSYLGNIPLTRLLSAQTAQLEGNKEAAQFHYTAMLDDKQTEIIAIKGLLVQARNEGDISKALFLAEKAYAINPNAGWVVQMLMELYEVTGRWEDAVNITKHAHKIKIINDAEYNRSSALIMLARGQFLAEHGSDKEALILLKKAYKLMPYFVPVVAAYARILIKLGKNSKSMAVIAKCWKNEPHPDLAEAFLENYNGSNGRKLLKNAEKMADVQSSRAESHILAARAAMLAEDFIPAYNHLKTALSIRETVSSCLLMAELEEKQGADKEMAAQWRKRAQMSNPDFIWYCDKCGHNMDKWKVTCNNCHSFDSLKWGSVPNQKINIIKPEDTLLA